MKRALPLIFDTLYALAWAIWLGSLVALWVAGLPPVVFILALRRVSGIIEFCGVVLIAVQFLARRRYQRNRSLFIVDGVRQLLTFGALLLAESCRYSLFPVMDSAQSTGRMSDFGHLRYLYTLLAIGQFALLTAVAALTAWLQLPRNLIAPTTASPNAAATPASVSSSAPGKPTK